MCSKSPTFPQQSPQTPVVYFYQSPLSCLLHHAIQLPFFCYFLTPSPSLFHLSDLPYLISSPFVSVYSCSSNHGDLSTCGILLRWTAAVATKRHTLVASGMRARLRYLTLAFKTSVTRQQSEIMARAQTQTFKHALTMTAQYSAKHIQYGRNFH